MAEQPKEWIERVLNSKSKAFCGAKWFNATTWLGNGLTTSCHHPPPHKIDANEVADNPSALHNTPYKKLVRKEMQDGIRPKECEYCWKIEDMGERFISDRFYKSEIYSEDDLATAFNSDWNADHTLQTFEIAFNNNCNFACSYCNAGFSSTWAHDINKNGAYQNLNSEGWGAFAHNGAWAQPYGVNNLNNPYVDAFWKWWNDELQFSLRQLRVTGGEPTTSSDFWKLLDWYKDNQGCKVKLAVNTNLGIKKKALQKLCSASKHITNFEIYTSNESYGKHAEYIRDGLVWEEWIENLKYVIEHGEIDALHMMLTLNALSLGSLDKLHEEMFDIRENLKYAGKFITMSYNILRFPSFQSITTLPENIRKERAAYYTAWLSKNEHRMYEHEIQGMKRTIAYILEVAEGHSVQSVSDLKTRQYDFYNFYTQYDERRGLDINDTFSDWPDLKEWLATLADNDNVHDVPSLIDADANNWGEPIRKEVFKNAKNAGHYE